MKISMGERRLQSKIDELKILTFPLSGRIILKSMEEYRFLEYGPDKIRKDLKLLRGYSKDDPKWREIIPKVEDTFISMIDRTIHWMEKENETLDKPVMNPFLKEWKKLKEEILKKRDNSRIKGGFN